MGDAPKYPDRHIERTIIEPLLAFRHKVGPLNALHNDCMQAFTTTMMGLLTGSDGGVEFQGPGSNALAEIVGQFLDGERQLAGSDPHVLEGRLLDAAIIAERYADILLDLLNGRSTTGYASVNPLTSMLKNLLDSGIGQDEDDGDPDQAASGFLGECRVDMRAPTSEPLFDPPDINGDVNTGPLLKNTEPLGPLSGANANFLKTLGILGTAAGGGAVLVAGAIIITNLTRSQEDLAQRLYAAFGSSDLTLDDIRSLIDDNPNLTEAQWRELLAKYGSVIAANPNLVKKYGALAVFSEFVALSAYNSAYGGNYPIRRPMQNRPNLSDEMDEAEAQLGVMEEGKVSWPLTPSTDSAYESTDPYRKSWDVKRYRSIDSDGKVYDPVDTVDKLEQKDFANGEKVIFDDSLLTPKEINDTYEEFKRRGLDRNVVWWPTQPS